MQQSRSNKNKARARLLAVLCAFVVVAFVWSPPRQSDSRQTMTTYSTPQHHHQQMTNSSSCPYSLQYLCSNNSSSSSSDITVQMAAIPHTASSSTDRVFRAANLAWNTALDYKARGFSCPPSKAIVEYRNCGTLTTSNANVSCIINKLRYKRKSHSNYNRLSARSQIKPFTILRDSHQFVLSQYNMRTKWDSLWHVYYPHEDFTTITPQDWASRAWWRHNLFTKMLATDTRLIWSGLLNESHYHSTQPTKEESDYENSLGNESIWFQVALERLKTMPFFGMMHRLTESFELMGFSLCFPVSATYRASKKLRQVDQELSSIVKKHFVLDSLLLQEAELLFDARIEDMRRKKARGMLCDLSALLEEPRLEF